MVVKCGSYGSYIIDCTKREYVHVAVVNNLQVVDVTGAGDAFCGGFLAGMFLTRDIISACAFGTVSASFIVESLGVTRPRNYHVLTAKRRLNALMRFGIGEKITF